MASSVSNAVSSSDNDDYDITTEASKDIASLKVKFKRAKDGNGVSKRDANGVSKRKSSTDSNPSSPKTKVKSKDGDELPPPFFFTSLAGGPPGGKLESLLKQAMKEPPIKKQKLNGDASPSLNGLHLTPVASNQLINGQICNDAATMTEPDSLGPCEPGTAVKLQGIVWQETEKGLLVLNVTWRGKTYMGTLLDCNKQTEAHKWGPPRDPQAGRGRKRGRNCRSRTPPVKNGLHNKKAKKKGSGNNNTFAVPMSPLAKEASGGKLRLSADLALKRLKADAEDEESADLELTTDSVSRLIECPKPECAKKFRDLDAIKFHLSFAHSDLKKPEPPAPPPPVKEETSTEAVQKETPPSSPNIKSEPTTKDFGFRPYSTGAVVQNGSPTAHYSDISDEENESKPSPPQATSSSAPPKPPKAEPPQGMKATSETIGPPSQMPPPSHLRFPGYGFNPYRMPYHLPPGMRLAPPPTPPMQPPPAHSSSPTSRALDILQQHGSQYLASTKLQELQERAAITSPFSPRPPSGYPPPPPGFPPRTLPNSVLRHEHSHTHLHVPSMSPFQARPPASVALASPSLAGLMLPKSQYQPPPK